MSTVSRKDPEYSGVQIITFLSQVTLDALEVRVLDYVERRVAQNLVEHVMKTEGEELLKRLDRKLIVDLANALAANVYASNFKAKGFIG